MQFGLAFSFPFQDPDWLKKIGIAALVSLIPLIGQIILLGWSLEVTRRVIGKDPRPLPDWSDFGGHTLRGLKGVVVAFVYLLPILILVGCVQGVMLSSTAITGQGSARDAAGTAFAILNGLFGCIAFIYGILVACVLPAAFGKMAASGNFGDAFRLGQVLGLVRAAPVAYLVTILGLMVAGVVASLGTIACGVGVLLTAAYSMAVNGHLYGQAYNAAVETPKPLAPAPAP